MWATFPFRAQYSIQMIECQPQPKRDLAMAASSPRRGDGQTCGRFERLQSRLGLERESFRHCCNPGDGNLWPVGSQRTLRQQHQPGRSTLRWPAPFCPKVVHRSRALGWVVPVFRLWVRGWRLRTLECPGQVAQVRLIHHMPTQREPQAVTRTVRMQSVSYYSPICTVGKSGASGPETAIV
jgi:hypothetical protein